MKKFFRIVLLASAFLFNYNCGNNDENRPATLFSNASAQLIQPVKWKFSVKRESKEEAILIAEAKVEKGWHLYSQTLTNPDGPRPTVFTFEKDKRYELKGETKEPNAHEVFDKVFEMNVKYFDGQAQFSQRVKILTAETFSIKGNVEFQACDDEKCTFETQEFEFLIEGEGAGLAPETTDTASPVTDTMPESRGAVAKSNNPYLLSTVDLNNPLGPCGEKREDLTLWGIFLLGILGGFIALLTPCVFPMIPLTVSFFTKSSIGKKGMRDSMLYGFFIMLIYFLLSVPFHLLPGIDPEVLNQISTNTWLNILFFAIFVVFAISFFGYFEITLPSKWANKADSASNLGGLLGIFFMALTLAIVSFSCTGPILGTLLAGTLNADSVGTIGFLGMNLQLVAVKLTIGMTGFGMALGLPFALFAAFPTWLNSLPKSGGWLNSVKVVLGFVEVALAVKFLSNADLVEQWGLLKRETFFALWFLCGAGLALYIFGIIKFPHDSPVKKFSPLRIFFGTASLAFTVYLFPGIIGAKWWNFNLLSGFPPPSYYSYFQHEHEKQIFTDFETGMRHAREKNKPVMIDFTGWACVNCRKMEENVWPDDRVKNILNEEYVVISLYVDERTVLSPEDQHSVDVPDGEGGVKKKKIKTVGDKWSTLEALTFANNTQPLYVLLSPDSLLLGNPVGYTPDIDEYVEYLNCGLRTYEEVKKEKPAN